MPKNMLGIEMWVPKQMFRHPINPQQKCHPDRSEAQWRDLLFALNLSEGLR